MRQLLASTSVLGSWCRAPGEIRKSFGYKNRPGIYYPPVEEVSDGATGNRSHMVWPYLDRATILNKGWLKIRSRRQVLPHQVGRKIICRYKHAAQDASRVRQRRPSTGRTKYRAEEDKTILDLREQLLSWPQIQRSLPDRTLDSIKNRYNNYLRIPQQSGPTARLIRGGWSYDFTSMESKQIVQLRESGLSLSQIQGHFPRRSVISIKTQLSRLAVSQRVAQGGHTPKRVSRWTTTDAGKLVRLKEGMRLSWPEIARNFHGRSAQSVRKKYNSLERIKT